MACYVMVSGLVLRSCGGVARAVVLWLLSGEQNFCLTCERVAAF
jgi:hypothetical protein